MVSFVIAAQTRSLQQEMDSLQETAREQLVNLAAQGENAVGVAQSQLMKAHNIIEQFQLFVKVTDSIKYCIRYIIIVVS